MTNVQLLYFEGCPSHEATADLVRDAIDRLGIDATVTTVDVPTEEEAERRGFVGSPSVRVDGEDIEPGASSSASYGLRCRVYETPEGLRGVPPVEMIEAALTGERYEPTGAYRVHETRDCCRSNARTKVELLVADWCPQCPAAKAFWTELAADEEFELEVIDVDSERGSRLAAEHGIRGVPATIVDGSVEFRDAPIPDLDSARRALQRS